ncbi:uncharacterized protein LOC121727433 [Aricia agestis]|uniref:uncharacterized protein LOC121727433 n=1 Tax=Aricia agestis TaxID=91739 RepID=UPI001C202D5C|nr:uncharacterized protein LOC121727433 [Aricia agestis]
MACSHCDAPVSTSGAAPYRGRLYHPHCRSCFVCGEEDLQDAETFKGVIFCCACARRIFAERARRRPRAPASPRVRPPCRTHRPRLRDLHTQTVYYVNTISASVNVPSLEKIAALDAMNIKTEPADNMAPVPQHPMHAPDRYIQRETGDMPAAPELLTNNKGSTEHKSTAADVELAELGASVELVQVALRRPSVTTLVIKSGSGFNLATNESLSHDFKPGSSESQATSVRSTCERPQQLGGGGLWRSTRLGSAVKIPFKLLKQNILDKRFIVSVHTRTEKQAPPSGLRDLFHDEISMHHRRGERVLYTTINCRSKPHELGWVSAATGTKNKRCRHYRRPSYRCLRAHVMRRAGPTRSDLHQFRGKIKKLVTGQFVGRLLREANLTNVRAG